MEFTHRRGEMTSGIPNPSLETMCMLVAKAGSFCTPAVQAKAFRQTGLTLPTDGSLDNQELSRSLRELLQKFNESLIPTAANAKELFLPIPPSKSLPEIFEVLFADAKKLPLEEFRRKAVLHKKSNR
jgi:hypothetical protein